MRTRRRRQLVPVAVVLVALVAGSCGGSSDPLDGRPFKVHEPPGYDGSKPAPLLIVLHGYTLRGDVQNAYYGLDPVTDPRGMLYVAPDGTVNAKGKRFWNATPACCAPAGSDVDDSAYLAAVIESVQRTTTWTTGASSCSATATAASWHTGWHATTQISSPASCHSRAGDQ